MKFSAIPFVFVLFFIASVSCRKKGCTDPTAYNYSANAKKDDGSCVYNDAYSIPSTYAFNDDSGNSTVNYSGQTDRLAQLAELTTAMKMGTSSALNVQELKDMFANTGGDGNGQFSFSSTKQLKDKCFSLDVELFEHWMGQLATASASNQLEASNGQAGTLTSGSSTYLFDENGREHVQLIEKGLMGAVFMYQALNVYFGEDKMNVDNTVAVNPTEGKYYTVMQHHWDEAFGYFGVDIDFPTTIPTQFWGKYCNKQNSILSCNNDMMSNFLKGRAAIGTNVLEDRNTAIAQIRKEWEEISAYQALTYLDEAIGYFGADNAGLMHALSEAYAFAWNLRYAPETSRRMTIEEHNELMEMFPTNFWSMTVATINAIKFKIRSKYE